MMIIDRFQSKHLQVKDWIIAPSIYLILTLLVFNSALIDPTIIVASDFGGDLPAQFLPWRKFGFDELRHGNLALWNPHIYGGAPYFGGFQSALLYPPNWLHLILPVGLAINWINALHVFAAGYFTNLWSRDRGLSVWASMLAGTMFMFSGAFYLRIYAGHLPHLAIMVWAPLLFLAIDWVIRGKIASGLRLGIPVITMSLLAGHPQYVYYTGLIAVLYVLINIWHFTNIPWGLAACLLMVLGGVAIASVQLLTGLEANAESVRSKGMDYQFISAMSFPPENMLTAIAPNVFGPLPLHLVKFSEFVIKTKAYFGREILWESSLFVSVGGLILAIYGMASRPWTKTRGLVVLSIVCFILALGRHTPLHSFLYNYFPGFSWFRGSAKFIYLIALFLSISAAYGFDLIVRAKRVPTGLIVSVAILLLSIAILLLAINASAMRGREGYWSHLLSYYGAGSGYSIDPRLLDNETFIRNSGRITSDALTVSAMVVAGILTILLVSRIRFAAIYLLLPVALVELVIFVSSVHTTVESQPSVSAQWIKTIRSRPENSRVIGINEHNMGMWFGYNDVWGYDPGVLKRYAELVTFSQGHDPDTASQNLQFSKTHFNIFPLLRVSGVLFDNPGQPMISTPAPMPVAQLIPKAVVLENRDEIFSALDPNSFDPTQTVLLERKPTIEPAGASDPGTVEILSQSTDQIELSVNAAANAMLLITNAYSRDWHARSVGPSVQAEYEILPADWALQAIPLMRGSHHLILEYRPRAFVVGKWISIISLLIYLGLAFWSWRFPKSTCSMPVSRLYRDG